MRRIKVFNSSPILYKGEVLGLVGDNAAGKSTLMKILSGAYHPTEGAIHFAGSQVKFRSPHDARNLGIEMLFQDLALVPELDVTDNLFLGKELYKSFLGLNMILDRRTMRSKSEGFLKQLGINIPSVNEKVRNLSGGQQQSVSIARTMFFEAKMRCTIIWLLPYTVVWKRAMPMMPAQAPVTTSKPAPKSRASSFPVSLSSAIVSLRPEGR